jgi:hypothetical protein
MPEPTWPDVEQILGEYADWTGESPDVRRISLDAMRPVDELLADVLGRLTA